MPLAEDLLDQAFLLLNKGTLVAKLKSVARAFRELQEQRHKVGSNQGGRKGQPSENRLR